MKIGIIGSRGYPSTYSGYETLVRELAPGLVHRGHTVTVYGRDKAAGTAARDGVQVVNLRAVDSKTLSTISHAARSVLHARTQAFDCVLGVNLVTTQFLRFLETQGVPCALNVDGLEWSRGKWGVVARSIFRASARAAARGPFDLIADSRRIADYYWMQYGAKSHFIPYGGGVREQVGTSRLSAAGLAPNGYLLVVARIVPENSIDLILDAYERISDGAPQLVVVGDANYRSPLIARLRAMSATGRVLWLGHLHDQELLFELWAHAALYLHGHSVGGTNPSLLQALGSGARTLPLDTPFNREVLGDPKWPCFEQEPERLAEMILRALDGSLEVIHGTEARSLVAARYSWQMVIDAYEETLQAVAVRGGTAP